MNITQRNLQAIYPCSPPDLEPLIEQMLLLRSELLKREASYPHFDKIHPQHLRSARNLLHYTAFRLHDLRELQLLLSEWGLSSLGRAERKVQATVDTVLHSMHILAGKDLDLKEKPPICYRDGRRRLEENAAALLGETPTGRRVRIMVTMPTEAAHDFELVKNLLQNGMSCARINCAHDEPEVWLKMIENIRRVAAITDKKCKICMDLEGPKLRTGEVEPGPAILKIRPQRDEMGRVTTPSKIWLFPAEAPTSPPFPMDASAPVQKAWLKKLKPGDRIRFMDARGKKRRLKIVKASAEGCLAEAKKTIYLVPGIVFHLKKKRTDSKMSSAVVGELPRRAGYLLLQANDLLLLTRDPQPGHSAIFDINGKLIKPATISCSLPTILDDVQIGEPIWFDDGKIGGKIERKEAEGIVVRITQTPPGGHRLRAEKGINLPESHLRLSALSEEDLRNLEFIVQHADAVSLSFANRPEDVEALLEHIRRMGKGSPGIILKIETRRGFDNLPALLLAAMQAPLCGVMIARGDLAIEAGFGRLAEVQEQILWFCEAAHMPVIWATQVLEGLAKSGLPSRSEITDAAMGERAECIMLNKGEHIVEATRALVDILHRMQDHQTKKRSLLRRLSLSEKFFMNYGK